MRALNFEQYQAEANEFLYDVMDELCVEDRNQAARVLRSVLQALRDRMNPDEAANFASQLPIIWKGIFYDGYNPSATPVKVRKANEWINFIREKNAFAAIRDFPTDQHVTSGFECVMSALQRRMGSEIIDKVMMNLPEELRELAYEPSPY